MLSDSDNCFPNSWEMNSLGLPIRAHRVDGGNGMAHRQAGDLAGLKAEILWCE